MFLHEIRQVVDGPIAVVLDRIGLLPTGGEIDRGEAFDLECLGGIVGRGVEFSQDQVWLALLQLGSQLFVLGLEGFTVATPWGIELDEDILRLVVDDLVEVGADEGLHRALVVLRHGGRLHEWLGPSWNGRYHLGGEGATHRS